MTPFWLDWNKETLFKTSDKAASKEATSFLLHVSHIGNRAPEEFIKECKSNPRKFEERIKKQKIHSFPKEGANFKLTNKNKSMEVKMERGFLELFYSFLYNGKLIWMKRWSSLWHQFFFVWFTLMNQY